MLPNDTRRPNKKQPRACPPRKHCVSAPAPIHNDPITLETSRDAAVAQVRALCPHLADDDTDVSPIRGGQVSARDALLAIDPVQYSRSRNHLDGAVTRLSPFIRHGVLSLADVRDEALSTVPAIKHAEKFVQQLAWRDYWQRHYARLGERIWEDIEPYKTGFEASDYAANFPTDIARAETGVAAIDHFLRQLIETGWLHNHARLYVAGYVCHWRKVAWQEGARFFLKHLLDGDPASNNLSWQWCASTFSHKPYFFNLENLQSFCGPDVDTNYKNNKALAGSYEDLHARLFPNLPPQERQERKPSTKRHKRAHH